MSDPTNERPPMPNNLDTCVVCGEPPERWAHWPDGSRVGLCASPECAAALDAMQMPDPARHITAPPSPRDGWDPALHALVDGGRRNLLHRVCREVPSLDWRLDAYPSFGVTATARTLVIDVCEGDGQWMARCQVLRVPGGLGLRSPGSDDFQRDDSLVVAIARAMLLRRDNVHRHGVLTDKHRVDIVDVLMAVLTPGVPIGDGHDRYIAGGGACAYCGHGDSSSNIWWPAGNGIRLPCCGHRICRHVVSAMLPDQPDTEAP